MSKWIITVPKEKLLMYLKHENRCCFCGAHISNRECYTIHEWVGNILYIVCSGCSGKVKKGLDNKNMMYMIEITGGYDV